MVRGWDGVGNCVYYVKHIIHNKHSLITSQNYDINLFSKICFPSGAILLRTKAICLKCMHRSISISVDYMLGKRYISYGNKYKH